MTKILTIGNSFSEQATMYLQQMAREGADELILGTVNLGGCSLEKHWNLYEQCRMLPEVKPYRFYKTGNGYHDATLAEVLKSEEWDYVTLQQVSDLSFKKETFFPYIENLMELVTNALPKAKIMLHQTWAYRCDANELKEYSISQDEMQKKIIKVYNELGKMLKCEIIPCGVAFHSARKVFNYKPDKSFTNPKPLELPDQSKSLIKGYFWATGNTQSGKAELKLDGRHGDAKGCYLTNAVWYETFFNKNVLENSFHPEGITKEELDILKGIAHNTMKNHLSIDNLI